MRNPLSPSGLFSFALGFTEKPTQAHLYFLGIYSFAGDSAKYSEFKGQ